MNKNKIHHVANLCYKTLAIFWIYLFFAGLFVHVKYEYKNGQSISSIISSLKILIAIIAYLIIKHNWNHIRLRLCLKCNKRSMLPKEPFCTNCGHTSQNIKKNKSSHHISPELFNREKRNYNIVILSTIVLYTIFTISLFFTDSFSMFFAVPLVHAIFVGEFSAQKNKKGNLIFSTCPHCKKGTNVLKFHFCQSCGGTLKPEDYAPSATPYIPSKKSPLDKVSSNYQ